VTIQAEVRTDVPTGTYRLQLRAEFGFAAAAAVVPYLADLGVSHLYLSPVLQAAPGSAHGYDVVDHARVSDELGGEDGLRALAATAAEHGLGIVVDVVPNHMAIPTPASLNTALWSVLRHGPASPYARWFDVDWSRQQQRSLLVPVLADRIGRVLEAGEIRLDNSGAEPVLRYHDHAFPVREGTEQLALPELVDRQWYRLAHWRVADEELNYRRFFDVGTLVAVRVEDPDVFDATHGLLLELHRDGVVAGFRIDHPDGLADPRGYVRRLAQAAPRAWIVVEKILEGDEQLPADWPCAGTTGYDALERLTGVTVDPAGAEPLTTEWLSLAAAPWHDFAAVAQDGKRMVLGTSLRAEVARLVDLAHAVSQDDLRWRDLTRQGIEAALVEVLVAFPVYRAYVVPGEPAPPEAVTTVESVVAECRAASPRLTDELAFVADLALGRLGVRDTGRRAEFVVRFQQTCGPVMAKGVEDTAFYRYHRLVALNEVGGRPGHFATFPDDFHAWAARRQQRWPASMTALTTHDTKRSEDVRARVAVLGEVPGHWHEAVAGWRQHSAHLRSSAGWPDPETEYLLWQTLVGTWPITAERLLPYLVKAMREAKVHTSWTEPDEGYESAVLHLARGVLDDPRLTASVAAFVTEITPLARVATLAQRLLQLTVPGVPDTYQGCERVALSLVDPDNRRPVDFAGRAAALHRLDVGERPRGLDDEKLLVVATALRLRRDHPEWFGPDGSYAPLPTTTTHALGFTRAERVATVVTRRASELEQNGGWRENHVVLPEGSWRDLLTAREVPGGAVGLTELLDRLPVALLVRG
jgi:(1->4)-alpha-D-glucan 1-alpha-D-glucosylmutase